MKIALCYDNLTLGYLTREDNKYLFYADSKAFKQAKNSSVLLFPIPLNEAGVEKYDELPYPYTNFINATDREDLISASKINQEDTIFEKLYKIAGLDYEHELFYIKQFND